jgi:Mg2+-importing ATPase
LAVKSTVVRDGKEIVINTIELLPGDLIVLNAGDLIPADAKLVLSKDFFVNQSSLTGESFPAEKYYQKDDENGVVYCGTNEVTGTAQALVINTGEHTEYGKLTKNLQKEGDENDFTKGIGKFSILILKIVIIFVYFRC